MKKTNLACLGVTAGLALALSGLALTSHAAVGANTIPVVTSSGAVSNQNMGLALVGKSRLTDFLYFDAKVLGPGRARGSQSMQLLFVFNSDPQLKDKHCLWGGEIHNRNGMLAASNDFYPGGTPVPTYMGIPITWNVELPAGDYNITINARNVPDNPCYGSVQPRGFTVPASLLLK